MRRALAAERTQVRDAADEAVGVAERLSPAWMLRRHWLGGVSGATFEIKNRGLWRALGKLRWYYRPHFSLSGYAPREPVDAARLERECARQEALGYVYGLVRGVAHLRALRREGPPHPIRPFPAAQVGS